MSGNRFSFRISGASGFRRLSSSATRLATVSVPRAAWCGFGCWGSEERGSGGAESGRLPTVRKQREEDFGIGGRRPWDAYLEVYA